MRRRCAGFFPSPALIRVSSLVLALAAFVAVSPMGVAQPTTSAAPSVYGRAGLHAGYAGGNVGLTTAPSAAVGVRLPSGLEVGGYVTRVGYGTRASVLAFGPEVRLERALSPTTTADLRVGGGVGFYSGEAYRSTTGLAATLEATVTRRFGLGRGLDLAATGGAYASALRLSVPGTPETAAYSGVGTDAGVLVGLQLEFDAFGGRVGVGPTVGLSLVGPNRFDSIGAAPYLGATRGRGFITFSF